MCITIGKGRNMRHKKTQDHIKQHSLFKEHKLLVKVFCFVTVSNVKSTIPIKIELRFGFINLPIHFDLKAIFKKCNRASFDIFMASAAGNPLAVMLIVHIM